MQTTTINTNRLTGTAYQPERSIQDTAKSIRAEIKKQFPEIKTSVRTQSYTGGSSLTISVLSVPFQAHSNLFLNAQNTNDYAEYDKVKDEYDHESGATHPDFTQEGEQLLEDLKTLANKYRYKEETIDHINTNFYLFVEYDFHFHEQFNA